MKWESVSLNTLDVDPLSLNDLWFRFAYLDKTWKRYCFKTNVTFKATFSNIFLLKKILAEKIRE